MVALVPPSRRIAEGAASCCALFCTLILGLCGLAGTPRADTGKWAPDPADWSDGNPQQRYAIHMVLLRGDGNPSHSRILWWRVKADSFYGGQRGWTSGNDGCAQFPGSNFVRLGVPSPDMDPFCSGHSLLGDGNALVAGGTDPTTGTYGENEAGIFAPGPGSQPGTWSTRHDMNSFRYYPTATTLADGRVLVTAGEQHRQHRIFGGLRNGLPPARPSGDTLYRFAPVAGGGRWDNSVLPLPDAATGTRPAPRYGHTGVAMEDAPLFYTHAQVYFGGRDSSGLALQDTWFLTLIKNSLAPDLGYQWIKKVFPGQTLPFKRSDHSAIRAMNSTMVIYGGLDENNTALGDVWRLFYDTLIPGYHWEVMTVSGTPPPARCGPSAIYDQTVDNTGVVRQRMIVFGGTSAPGQTPTDLKVWELRFDPQSPNSATWSEMTQVDLGSAKPAPRYWHTLIADSTKRIHTGSVADTCHAALLFGGALGGSAYSDTLWALWIFRDGRVGWEPRVIGGTTESPSARARHSATYDLRQSGYPGRLYVFGGTTATGAADSHVYAVDPWAPTHTWSKWVDLGFSLSGQSSLLDEGQLRARAAEVYDPVSDAWTVQSSTTLFQQNYPPTFLVPGGSGKNRIITTAYDSTLCVDIPATGQAGSWKYLSHGYLGFLPSAGVQYLPGRVMVAGGIDYQYQAVGTTTKLDARDTSNSWVTSGSMVPRNNVNLVLLPNGQVLAVGGNTGESEPLSGGPVRRPQIWDPDANGVGAWSDTTLDIQPTVRGHHSTAILLPDGRVLSGGGEAADRHRFDLFCPPYLFTSGGASATRPLLDGATDWVRYGQDFWTCFASNQHVKQLCLIRPGATTHAFDENQRYVPLTIRSASASTDSCCIQIVAVADSFTAPPGDYLLFVVNNYGVPSVAKWVRLGSVWNISDSVPPDTIRDLASDVVTTNSVVADWTGAGDDVMTGVASRFDLRKSTSEITPANFSSASQVGGVPTPACPGTYHFKTVSGLSSGTCYYFAIKTVDESGNAGGISHEYVTCGATLGGSCPDWCSGGGNSVSQAVDEDAPPPAPRTLEMGLTPSLGGSAPPALVAELEGGGKVSWKLYTQDPAAVAGLPQGVTGGVAIQESDDAGSWRTLFHFDDPDTLMGLRSRKASRRFVFLGGTTLQTVELDPIGYHCSRAEDSRTGDLLGDSLTAAAAKMDLAAGDTLSLDYERASGNVGSTDFFFVVRAPGPAAADLQTRVQGESGSDTPVVFGIASVVREGPGFRIALGLPEAAEVRLEIFDLLGRRTATLTRGRLEAGRHEVTWNATAADGARVHAGMYVCRLTAGARTAVRKMMLVP